jgi:hypothetical protein
MNTFVNPGEMETFYYDRLGLISVIRDRKLIYLTMLPKMLIYPTVQGALLRVSKKCELDLPTSHFPRSDDG